MEEVVLIASIEGNGCIRFDGPLSGSVKVTFPASEGEKAAQLVNFTECELEVIFRKRPQ